MDVSKDARNRAWRTLLQGAVVTVMVAVLPVVYGAIVNSGDITAVNWAATGTAALTASATSAMSWVWRELLDNSGVPSATPENL